MKKKLEAELVSIAHRILKLKNKSDLVQLHQETQKLYEKLSVLRFVEENFAAAKPTIGYAEIEDKLAVIFDNDLSAGEPATSTEPVSETISDIISGISENATKQAETETEITNESETETPNEEIPAEATAEPIAELPSPEESVAPIEAEATEAAAEANEKDNDEEKPEPAPEPEPEKIEEPAEEQKPKEIATDTSISEPAKPTKSEDIFKPAFEWGFEAKAEESKSDEPKITPAQISFDDLLGQDYVDPVFVKPEEMETPAPKSPISEDERRAAELADSNKRLADLREASSRPIAEQIESRQNVIPISRNFSDTSNVISINKDNLNDRISKGITIGLNDRIAFMKHLFNNSSEDYNRVLSQLITFDTLPEAQHFIDTMVKPDYNNWEGKDEYEQRFMEIIEKKFS